MLSSFLSSLKLKINEILSQLNAQPRIKFILKLLLILILALGIYVTFQGNYFPFFLISFFQNWTPKNQNSTDKGENSHKKEEFKENSHKKEQFKENQEKNKEDSQEIISIWEITRMEKELKEREILINEFLLKDQEKKVLKESIRLYEAEREKELNQENEFLFELEEQRTKSQWKEEIKKWQNTCVKRISWARNEMFQEEEDLKVLQSQNDKISSDTLLKKQIEELVQSKMWYLGELHESLVMHKEELKELKAKEKIIKNS